MNFDLGSQERALQDGIRELCRRRFATEQVRQGFDAQGWKELGAAGVFGLRLPEADGGVGLGMVEAVLVFEELGRALVPGPLVASHLAAGLVDGAATGERVVGHVPLADGPATVEHLDALDVLLGSDDTTVVTLDAGAGREELDPLDPLTPLLRIEAPVRGDALPVEASRFRGEGALLTAALLTGIALETTGRAVGYAKERVQFDRPIGSFQAVKHLCADMLVGAEVARAAVHAAACVHDDPATGDVGRAVAGAKLLAGEHAVRNAKSNIQVHGGMGFTWEVDAHLFLKRAAVLSTHFGGVGAHAEAIAASL